MPTPLERPVAARLGKMGARVLRSRWFVRSPIRLFVAGHGWLFGSRLLMIEHTGRRTGLPRRVVLEVVDHPSPDTYLVASGFGRRSQWFRNIEARPQVRLWVGRHRGVSATTRSLSSDQAVAAIRGYAEQRPVAWAVLKPVFEATLGGPAAELPLVAVTTETCE